MSRQFARSFLAILLYLLLRATLSAMDAGFEDRKRYWEASRRVQETFYRYTLADLLAMVFDVTEFLGGKHPPVAKLDDEEFEHVVRLLQDKVIAVERAWEPAMEGQYGAGPLPPDARSQVARAFRTLRAAARSVADGPPAFFARTVR